MENSLVMMDKMYVEYGCTFDLRSFPFDSQKCAMNFSMDSAKANYIVLSPNEIEYQVRANTFYLKLFLSTSQTERLFLCFAPQVALLGFLIERGIFPISMIFLPPYAATWNQTHVSRVASHRGTLIQDTLPTELPWPRPITRSYLLNVKL